MSRKSLLKSESAAAIAIAAVLLLGVAFTAIAVVKLNYTPEWKIDAERDYSYDAWSNMEDVKTRADIFTRFMGSDINYPYGLSATVPFSMGGGDVPVFEPSKSNSKLAVNTEECKMSITLAKHPDAPRTVDCGGVTYYSENRQYPDQVFRYENGALILAQGENSQMKRKPSFDIQKNDTSGNYTVTINAINLTGEPESISSSTFTALRLTGDSINSRLNSNDYNESVDSFNLSISTRYTDAWVAYLNDTTKDAGLVYNTDYTIESIPDDYVCISFNLPGKLDDVYVNETEICAELGRREGFLKEDTVMRLGKWYNFDTFTGIYNGITISNNPDQLKDYNEDYSLPSGNFKNEKLSSYNEVNNFSYYVDPNKVLNLDFGFNSSNSFGSNITTVTIRMIYKFEDNQVPTMEMTIAGTGTDSFKPNGNNWCLYNQTFTVQPSSLDDLTLNLKVISTNNNIKGNFDIDYLAVYLS